MRMIRNHKQACYQRGSKTYTSEQVSKQGSVKFGSRHTMQLVQERLMKFTVEQTLLAFFLSNFLQMNAIRRSTVLGVRRHFMHAANYSHVVLRTQISIGVIASYAGLVQGCVIQSFGTFNTVKYVLNT